MYTFEVDDNNAVRIFREGQEAPVIFQPDWPNGTPWADKAEATSWAELYVRSFEDAEVAELPGDSPEEPTRARPEAPEVPVAE